MKQKLTILIVEDNHVLRLALVDLFEQAGHRVLSAESADEIHDVLRHEIHVVVLDINLPGENGYSISARLRSAFPRLGIIMLTAMNSSDNTLQGYLNGADNYFVKPFNANVLLAAVEGLGERVLKLLQREAPPELQLDLVEMTLCCANNIVALTPTEVTILQQLVLAPDTTLENWQLMNALSMDLDQETSKHNLEVVISRLRRKLEQCCMVEKSIKGIRGVGYRLMLPLAIT